jgi:uncharacterized membrane protein YfcA
VPICFWSAGNTIVAATGLWLVFSIGVIVGTFLGVPVLSRIPESLYRRLVGGLLLLLGISLLTGVF